MPIDIRRAAVIGAGTMGSGIAAHLANAGIPVLLLDIVPAGASERNALAAGALARMRTQAPAPFMSADAAALVTPGNLEDDLQALAEVDWIIEAVLEDPTIKHALYTRIDAVRRPGSIVSSNTSTIPLQALIAGQSATFAADFAITHFFNPPRYMRLLELVTGPATRPEVTDALRTACDVRLGKTVVHCKDTPGFIANRIGTYFMVVAMHEAVAHGLTVEEADAVCGKPMGLPKTGVFGLTDLVGLDLMPHIAKSFHATLPADDPMRQLPAEFGPMARLIAAGNIGRKSPGGGFTRLVPDANGKKKVKQVVDLQTGEYRDEREPRLASLDSARGKSALATLVRFDDRGGRFAAALLAKALGYAAALVPAIADRVSDVDAAMRAGYGWKFGPFELLDQLTPAGAAQLLTAHGVAVPPMIAHGKPFYRTEQGRLQELLVDGSYADVPRADGVLLLSDVKRRSKPVLRTASASVWDVGDGVLCVEFTSKMNTLDPEIMRALRETLALAGDGRGAWKAIVIHNEADNFSVGANLGLALFSLNVALYGAVEQSVAEGQQTYLALQRAPVPVVTAVQGMALGGGTEILLHSTAVQAHAESYIGLVETGVGIVPGWGGCKEMAIRASAGTTDAAQTMAAIGAAFQTIATAKTSASAAEAKQLGFLRTSDGITMNRDRLLADAKARALALAASHTSAANRTAVLPGARGKAMLMAGVQAMAAAGKATAHDQVVAGHLASVLTGGDAGGTLDEQALLDLERAHFMHLARTPATLARIEHMLNTGKPLRN